MALFNFSCPHCNQLVQGDDQWTGQQIQCPVCNGGIIVPQNAAAPAPPPSAPSQPQKPASKLKVTAAPHSHSAGPTPPPPAPPTSMPRPTYSPAKAKKKGDAAKWIKMAVVIVACGVGFYFGFGLISKWQAKLSESKDDSGGGLGGEAGHIVALNDALDRTDPDHLGMSSKEAAAEKRREARAKARFEAEQKRLQNGSPTPEGEASAAPVNAIANATVEMASMPLASGVWSMDPVTSVPEGRANGMISGTNFVVDTAVLVKVGPTQILTLRQGTNATSDRELFVSFQLGAGEELAGHTWDVSKDMRGKEVPQVVKRWKTNPRYAPSKKAFSSGYSMKLEFAQPTNGIVAGKISVSLPDTEQSYVVGAFKAAMLTPGAPVQ